MAANVETMFYVREKPWHGLGTKVMEAPTSKDALILAGLDWKVQQKPIFTESNQLIPGYKANVRDIDNKALGVVSDKYKVIQNDKPLHLLMLYLVKVSDMKLPVHLKVAKLFGC